MYLMSDHVRTAYLFLSLDTTKALVHAFVTSRVDYCNSLYTVFPPYKSAKYNVFYATARVVSRTPRYCHVTPLLRELHWLPVRQRMNYKILLVTFKTIHEKSPVYLQELISVKMPGAYRLRSSSNGLLLEPLSFRTRATLGDRSFQVAAPKLWNGYAA